MPSQVSPRRQTRAARGTQLRNGFLLFLFAVSLGEAAQAAGSTSAAFLRLGAGARASAMGESGVALADDAGATFWNPAGLLQFNEYGVHFTHSEWLVGLKHEFAGAVYRFGKT